MPQRCSVSRASLPDSFKVCELLKDKLLCRPRSNYGTILFQLGTNRVRCCLPTLPHHAGHDPNDYEIGKRCNLEIINIMNKDATLNGNAGKYAGMDRFKARAALWTDMEAAGLVIKKEPYTIRCDVSGVNHSTGCDVMTVSQCDMVVMRDITRVWLLHCMSQHE